VAGWAGSGFVPLSDLERHAPRGGAAGRRAQHR
jgi:hypothetical protein